MTQTSAELYTKQQSLSAATWSKFAGTEADWTSCLMTTGAPFKKNRAEPLGMPLDTTTTPDLKLFELNSSTLTTDSSARLLEGWDRVGCLGRTTVALSCMRRCDCEKSVEKVLQLLWNSEWGVSVYILRKLTVFCQ